MINNNNKNNKPLLLTYLGRTDLIRLIDENCVIWKATIKYYDYYYVILIFE